MKTRFFTLVVLILALSIFVGCGGSDVPQYAFEDFDEDEYELVSLEELSRNPDDYIGKPIMEMGTVYTELTDADEYCERIIKTKNHTEYMIGYSPDIVQGRLIEDDVIVIYGVFLGLTDSAGKYPYIWATKIEMW